MLACSHCQTENADDARLCRECGRELSARDTSGVGAPDAVRSYASGAPGAAPATVSCPSCGQSAPADAEFCPRCGKSISGAEYGSFWRRFGGFLIDAIILSVVGGTITLLVSPNASSIMGLLIGLGYSAGLNANGGTLGKRAVGLRLEDAETGEDIGYGRAFLRYIVAIASALALLLGYLWCIWDGKKQTWHDMAADSVVVRAQQRGRWASSRPSTRR